MRILVTPGMVPEEHGGAFGGGAAFVAWSVAKAYADLGHEVWLFPNHPFSRDRVIEGVHVLRHDRGRGKIGALLRPRLSLAAALSVARIVSFAYSRNRARKTLIWLWYADRMARAIADCEPDYVHVHGNSMPTLVLLSVLEGSGRRILFTSHGLNGFDRNIVERLDYDIAWTEWKIFKLLVAGAAKVTAVSSEIAETLASSFGVSGVWVIFNGVDEEFFLVDQARDGRKMVLLTVGSVSPRKNQRFVIEALSKLPSDARARIEYRIVGPGEEEYIASLRRLAEELGISEMVSFLGPQPHSELPACYREADLLVLCSTSEGFPLVFFEAGAAGVPLLTVSTLQGASDYSRVVGSENMLAIASHDVNEAAAVLRDALENRAQLQRMGAACRMRLGGFRWLAIAEEYVRLAVDEP